MCYHRRTIHHCHHITMGALISACSRRPLPPDPSPCPFQWSRAIFTVRSPSKCRACARLDRIVAAISTLATTSSVAMDRVEAYATARRAHRSAGTLPHQRPWAHWDTAEVRCGTAPAWVAPAAAVAPCEVDGCASDPESDVETLGGSETSADSESGSSVSGRSRSGTVSTVSSMHSFGGGSVGLDSIQEDAESDNLKELEEIEYIAVPRMSSILA